MRALQVADFGHTDNAASASNFWLRFPAICAAAAKLGRRLHDANLRARAGVKYRNVFREKERAPKRPVMEVKPEVF